MKKLLLANSKNTKEQWGHAPKLVKNYLSLILTIGLFMFTTIASAQVLWTADTSKHHKQLFADFDTNGYKDSGSCGDFNHEEPTLLTIGHPKYGKVWKINKKKGRKRAELARPLILKNKNQDVKINRPFPKIPTKDFLIPEDGDLVYYAWRWKITSTTTIKDPITVWQWKSSGNSNTWTQNYPLTMNYDGKTLRLNAVGPDYPTWDANNKNIKRRTTTIWDKSVEANKWVHFIVAIKLSKDPKKGYAEFWFDGKKQILKNSDSQDYNVTFSSDKKRAYHKTNDGAEIHPKWGAYNANACDYNVSTYYAELKMAGSFSDVDPSVNGGGDTGDNGGPTGYTFAANEKGTVNVSGTVNIAFGANGKFKYKYNVTSNTACNNSVFGDPIKGTAKKCYIKSVSTTKPQLSGTYYLDNVGANERLKSNNAATDAIATNTTDLQSRAQWRFTHAENGYYYIENVDNGRRLQGTSTITNEESSIRLANGNAGTWVQWELIPIGGNWLIQNRGHDTKLRINASGEISAGESGWSGDFVQWKFSKDQ